MYGLGPFFFIICCLHVNKIVYEENALARPVMDCNICVKFHLHILPGFWDTLIETERQQQQQQEFWKLSFLNKSSTYFAI